MVIFSPIKIGQFQCPSPTELIQFHCHFHLAGTLCLVVFMGFLVQLSAITLSVLEAKECDGDHQIVGSPRLPMRPSAGAGIKSHNRGNP